MVVGPLMQGVVLMGIIYWYSKGMFSMINDYYRSEFQRKLHEINDTTLDTPNYDDIENFDELLNVENFIDGNEIENENAKVDWIMSTEILNKKYEERCYGSRNLAYFMYLIGLNSSVVDLECSLIEEKNLMEDYYV